MFVWDKTASGTARRKTENIHSNPFPCCSLLSQRQSCPIQKRGADQLCSPLSVLLLAVPEAVSSHTKVRRTLNSPAFSISVCHHIHYFLTDSTKPGVALHHRCDSFIESVFKFIDKKNYHNLNMEELLFYFNF